MHVVFLWLAQSHLFLCWSVVLALALPVPHTYWLELMLLATAQALAEAKQSDEKARTNSGTSSPKGEGLLGPAES
eukprot:scaffold69997_cov19-Tisochrysis_lutea.AAC.4